MPGAALPEVVPNRVLVKLRPTASLGVGERRADLRLLFDRRVPSGGFGAAAAPQWYLADLPDAPTL
ncbi:MAG: hypothetical protein ACLGIF_00725, partial [Actinomycetes bacterium]